jgi:CheY-like chemotaxis protein
MSLKILVVDDEPDVLKLIKSIVEPWGYEVLTLSDSREAARRLETEKFDGVVLDILMPHVDGFELVRRAQASSLNRRAPVVIITALTDPDTLRKCFALGVTFVLHKPFSYERMYSLFSAARGSMLQERRRHARLPFCTIVECRHGAIGERQFQAISVNLGENGILLETSGGLEVGDEVVLEFALPPVRDRREPPRQESKKPLSRQPADPPTEPCTIRGRVVRKGPPDRIVVQFADVAPQNRQAIQRYIMGRVAF